MSYKLSRDVIDLGQYLMNVKTGELYEVEQDGRMLLSNLNTLEYLFNKSDIFNFMFNEGLLVDSSEKKDRNKFLLQLHLLNDCNLKCLHCYDWKDPVTSLTFEQNLVVLDNFVVFLKKMEMDGEISFTGGETLLYYRLIELIDYTKSQDVYIKPYVLTNGTIPPKTELLECLIRNDVGVQISIDGTEMVHDEIRGTGNYYKAVNGIKTYLAAGLKVSVHYVIMRRNIKAIPEFIREMERLEVKRINFSSLVPIGPGAQEEMLTPNENHDVIESIAFLQKEHSISLLSTRPLWSAVGSSGFCPVGYTTLTIDPSGKFLPCRRLPIILGDARYDTFFRVWFGSEFLQKMREREKYIKICGTCIKANVCGGCRAIAYALTNDAFAPDPSCWCV
ncbi:MAG: radical SAM protein [Burkholderiales bacterium]|nr:radical SAM protein [Burkholderiales bacterium]